MPPMYRAEGRPGKHQYSSYFSACPAARPYFKAAPFVLDTPDCCGKSSNGWKLTSSTGNLTPRVVLTQPPPLPATDHGGGPLQRSDVRLDGSIIVPASDHGRYREPPGTDSRLFLAPCQTEQAKDLLTFFSVVSCCSCPADFRAAAVRALTFAKEAGMCLMNGYAVFKVRLRGHKKPLTLFAVG